MGIGGRPDARRAVARHARPARAERRVRTYIIRRLLFFVPVLLAASIVTFMALRLIPGDPALTFLGQQARPEEIERWHKDHGTEEDRKSTRLNSSHQII